MAEKRNNYKGGFIELEVWKEARIFRKEISALTKKFPDTEKFRLTDQLLRASRSVTACIAEGYGRYHYQENIQFCRQSRGSLMECLDHLTCALDEHYIDDEVFEKFEKQYSNTLKMINGYIAYLKRKKMEG
jgi:four helix bundle protein